MRNVIAKTLAEAAELKQRLSSDESFIAAVENTADALKHCSRNGGTVFSCGNGGSACDAMHITEELVARFKRERPGIRAMHFIDPSTLTCWANDYDYATVFKRQAETFCTSKDVLMAFSTSGNSINVLAAVHAAKNCGAKTIGLLGRDGGKIAEACDIPIVVPAELTARIQEVHITIVHILCELMES